MAAQDVLQNRNLVSDEDICSGPAFTALRPWSPRTLRGTGVRIHRGPGDSVSKQRPNIQTRLNSDQRICLLDWGSPCTLRSVSAYYAQRLLVMVSIRTKQWGLAWVALAIALGLHVVDEAITGFLPLYNSTVGTIRDFYPWIPLPIFTFSVWLTGLIAGVLILLLLSPMVFNGNKIFRPISYFLGLLMTLNALAHIGGSLYLDALAPGVLSSPVLLVAAVALLVTTRRVRQSARGVGEDA